MTLSLDGFVVGPQDSVDAPMGVGGFRLFDRLDRRFDPGPDGQVFAKTNATRAVIAGRRTYEHAGRWQGDHHDGVPVFVLTVRGGLHTRCELAGLRAGLDVSWTRSPFPPNRALPRRRDGSRQCSPKGTPPSLKS